MTAGRRPNEPEKRETGDGALSAKEAADLKQESVIELSLADSRIFAEALANPQPVTGRLEDTIRRYRERSHASRSGAAKKG